MFSCEIDLKNICLRRVLLTKIGNKIVSEARTHKINCPCGSITNKHDKVRHEGSNKHQKYLQNITIHNLQNLTINVFL